PWLGLVSAGCASGEVYVETCLVSCRGEVRRYVFVDLVYEAILMIRRIFYVHYGIASSFLNLEIGMEYACSFCAEDSKRFVKWECDKPSNLESDAPAITKE